MKTGSCQFLTFERENRSGCRLDSVNDRGHADNIPGSHTGILHSENWSLTTNMGREFNLYNELQIIWQKNK